MNNLISVIIPIYNSSQYLDMCLNSCICQSYSNVEIICVDDGSTDNSAAIVKLFQEKDDRIKYFFKENGGLVSSRKFGLFVSKGQYVFFLDSDDYIEQNSIELLFKRAVETKSNYVIGNIVIERIDKTIIRKTKNLFKIPYYSKEAQLANFISKSIIPSLCGRLIRRELFFNYQVPNDVSIGEDAIANILMVINGDVSISLIDDFIYHYIQYSDSMLNGTNCSKRLDYILYVKSIFDGFTINEHYLKCSYSKFFIEEIYSYLRDGGYKVKDQHNKVNQIIKANFFNTYIFKEIPIWRLGLVFTYYISPVFSIMFVKVISVLRKQFFFRIINKM